MTFGHQRSTYRRPTGAAGLFQEGYGPEIDARTRTGNRANKGVVGPHIAFSSSAAATPCLAAPNERPSLASEPINDMMEGRVPG